MDYFVKEWSGHVNGKNGDPRVRGFSLDDFTSMLPTNMFTTTSHHGNELIYVPTGDIIEDHGMTLRIRIGMRPVPACSGPHPYNDSFLTPVKNQDTLEWMRVVSICTMSGKHLCTMMFYLTERPRTIGLTVGKDIKTIHEAYFHPAPVSFGNLKARMFVGLATCCDSSMTYEQFVMTHNIGIDDLMDAVDTSELRAVQSAPSARWSKYSDDFADAVHSGEPTVYSIDGKIALSTWWLKERWLAGGQGNR